MEMKFTLDEKTLDEGNYKKAKRLLDKMGIFKMTKLEKLADSFSNVRYLIHPDKENQDIGFIDFKYGDYCFKKNELGIKEIANTFYNKEDYIISVTTFDEGFHINIMDNFIRKIFDKIKTK
jgi:hypothetical protein